MSEPEVCELGDLIEFQRGYDLPKSDFVVGPYPVQSSNGVLGYHNEFKVKGPGITIGRSGTVGIPHLIECDFFPHNTALFIKDFKGNDVKYIYYLLKNLRLGDRKSGSSVPTMNRNHLHPLKVKIFRDVDYQNKLSCVLDAIDKKIYLNNNINTELEAMAKLIYDYWFVQFDFPDENGKPYKSSGGKMVYNEDLKREIPQGWEVIELGDLVNFQKGISYSSKDIGLSGIPMINLNSFYLDGSYKKEGIKYFNGRVNPDRLCKKGDLVIAVTDVTRNAEIIGKGFSIPDLFFGDVLISTDVAKVELSDRLTQEFTSQLFNSESYHNYIKYFATGTLVLHLDLNGIRWSKIALPPLELQRKYSEISRSAKLKFTYSMSENQTLSELRDWLLPMLMNGQVTVSDPSN